MEDAIKAIDQRLETVNKYIGSDPGLERNRSILERALDPYLFDKLVNCTAGVRNIHYVDYNGTQVPMRLLTRKEEIEIRHSTAIEFKQYPEFIGGENHPVFSQIQLVKTLSRATTKAPELPNEAFFTEKEVFDLPDVVINYLLLEYSKLQEEYNLMYKPSMDGDISLIIDALLDGAPINEKKLILLRGLNSSILLEITIRLLTSMTLLEDSIRFISLLKDSMKPDSTD